MVLSYMCTGIPKHGTLLVLSISFFSFKTDFYVAQANLKFTIKLEMALNFLISCLYLPSVGMLAGCGKPHLVLCGAQNQTLGLHLCKQTWQLGFTPSINMVRDFQCARVCLYCFHIVSNEKVKAGSPSWNPVRIKCCKDGKHSVS